MTTLSDTPTPTTLKSETGGVSIKIEQGVLCENEKYEGNRFNVEVQDIPTIKHESSNPSAIENHSNGGSNDSMLNDTPSIFQADFEVKKEPGVDIDDRHPDEEYEDNQIFQPQIANDNLNIAPKIRLTPTSKLIASPNGSIENKRRYICPHENCTKSYGKSSHLRSHLTWHTGIKPFVCKEPSCNKGFTRSDELNRHIRTHTGEKPFECMQCTKKFSRSDHLTKHLATHSKKLAAGICALAKKNKMVKNVAQDILKATSKIAVIKNQYTKEMNFIHTSMPQNKFSSPDLSTDPLDVMQENSFQIKLEQPDNRDDFATDITEQKIIASPCQTSPMQQIEPSIKEESIVIVKTEPMNEPHKNMFAKISIEPNDDDIMPEANLPPLPQNSTLRPAAVTHEELSLLTQTINHMADSVYDPTRPFPCCHCNKNFKRQDDLNRHMRTHTGEKPFACNECDKRFMRSDHLKKHLKTHTRLLGHRLGDNEPTILDQVSAPLYVSSAP